MPGPPLLLLQRYVLTLEEKRGAFVPPALREKTLFTATGEHGGTGEFSLQPLREREREYERERGSKQVPEKAVCVLSRAKKG